MNPNAAVKPGNFGKAEAVLEGWKVFSESDRIPGQGDQETGIKSQGVDQIHSRVSILSNSGPVSNSKQERQWQCAIYFY